LRFGGLRRHGCHGVNGLTNIDGFVEIMLADEVSECSDGRSGSLVAAYPKTKEQAVTMVVDFMRTNVSIEVCEAIEKEHLDRSTRQLR
jgi:hypothetical protein